MDSSIGSNLPYSIERMENVYIVMGYRAHSFLMHIVIENQIGNTANVAYVCVFD